MRLLPLIVFSSLLPAQTFESASIKPHAGPPSAGQVSVSGLHVNADSCSILNLILWAYNVKAFQISAATPLDNALYDLDAKAENGRVPTTEEFRAMMQSLLTERFGLKARRVSREIPVYAMTVSPSGAKIAESTPGDYTPRTTPTGRVFHATLTSATAEDLADYLRATAHLDRPVVNLTGLKAAYDIELQFTPENRMPPANRPDPSAISIFEAVKNQLGLELIRRAAPVELLIVDHVSKPTPN